MARPQLSPYALSSVETARKYLKRGLSETTDTADDIIIMALNAVAGLFEREVGRRLACRTYRSPVTIACTATAGDETLEAASGLLALKTLDDAVGSLLLPGSRVASITSDTALELTKKATGTGTGAVSVTFGSEPLVVDGNGSNVVYVPERPVVDVYSVKYLDADGNATAMDLTNARLDKETGRYMVRDVFPRGDMNIRIEAKAGYREPGTTERGDWVDWSNLEQLSLRAVQVMFQDFEQQAGRTGEITLAAATMRIQDFTLPADIRDGLRRYVQPW